VIGPLQRPPLWNIQYAHSHLLGEIRNRNSNNWSASGFGWLAMLISNYKNTSGYILQLYFRFQISNVLRYIMSKIYILNLWIVNKQLTMHTSLAVCCSWMGRIFISSDHQCVDKMRKYFSSLVWYSVRTFWSIFHYLDVI